MKYFFLFTVLLTGLNTFSQASQDYFRKMAIDVSIKRPVPPKFASRAVRVPIKTDSFSMEEWHRTYILRMRVGTGLLGGGILLVAAHILVAAFVPHYNRNAVIATAAVGVGTMTTGSILLPVATSERHRYKKTLRIELAKRGL